MCDLLQRINNLIHQEINPYSPANASLYRIYKEEPQRYEAIMIEQTNRYKSKNSKYFNEPSMHINLLYEEQ